MKVITFEDIKALSIEPSVCYQWATEMIKNKNEALLPPKISIKPLEGVFCNVMPSFVPTPNGQMAGVKVVTRYPSRAPALDSKILLFDAETGEYLALMDGDWITAMRTGSVAAHSILTFAKTNFSVIGIMGLGNISRATLEVLSNVWSKDREYIIKLLRFEGEEELFVSRFKNISNVRFDFVDTCYELVKGSDVVLSGVTYAPNDFCSDEAFDKGVLVQPIHTLGFTNCDLFFDKIFADDYGHVCHFKNFDKFKSFAEVCDVVNGKAFGRESDEERILAYNIGISAHDINFAARIYQLLKDNGSLMEIDLKGPIDRYWV